MTSVIDCPICMDAIVGTVNQVTTECGHCFHTNCLMSSVAFNGFGCPYCRTVMAEKQKKSHKDDEDSDSEDSEDDDSDYEDDEDDSLFDSYTENQTLRGFRLFTNNIQGLEHDELDIVDETEYAAYVNARYAANNEEDDEDEDEDEEEEDEDEESQSSSPPIAYIIEQIVKDGVITLEDLLFDRIVDYNRISHMDEKSFQIRAKFHQQMCKTNNCYRRVPQVTNPIQIPVDVPVLKTQNPDPETVVDVDFKSQSKMPRRKNNSHYYEYLY